MASRIRQALISGRAAVQALDTAELPLKTPARSSWALIAFDHVPEFETQLRLHLARCEEKFLRALVISNNYPTLLIGHPDVVFEFAPVSAGASDFHVDGPLAARDYLFRRLALIVDFWDVIGCDWTGEKAGEILSTAPSFATAVVKISNAT